MKRATTNPHTYRREVEDRMQHMPLATDDTGLTMAQKLEGIACVAFVAVPFAGWLFGRQGAGWSALILGALAITQFVLSRRPM